MTKMVDNLERLELIQKLVDNGYGQLIEAMLYNENRAFTRSGRINKSGTCRILGWKTKQLEDAFNECRKILGTDIFS